MATSGQKQSTKDTACLHLINDPSFIVNDKGLILQANNVFFKKFDVNHNDVIDKKVCEEICGNPLCGTKDCPLSTARRIHKTVSAETIYKHGNDAFSYYKTTATPLSDVDDSEMLVTMQDISNLKNAEAKLDGPVKTQAAIL